MPKFLEKHLLKIVVLILIIRRVLSDDDPVQFVKVGVVGIAIATFIVFIHELGHALLFNWRGVGIEAFAVGFGKPILYSYWRGIELRIGWIPAGGYVMPLSTETLSKYDKEQLEFWRVHVPERYTLLHEESRYIENVRPIDRIWGSIGGPFFSIAYGVAATMLVFAFAGVPEPLMAFHPYVSIVEVVPGSDAAAAGVKAGDRIIKLNDDSKFAPEDIGALRQKNEPATITLRRSGRREPFTVELNPAPKEGDVSSENRSAFGIRLTGAPITWSQKPPHEYFYTALAINFSVVVGSFCVLPLLAWTLFVRFQTAAVTKSGGGIAVIAMLGSFVDSGLPMLVYISAIISSSVGGLNLFPACFGFKRAHALLDGGKIAEDLSRIALGKDNFLFLWWGRLCTPVTMMLFGIILWDLVRGMLAALGLV